MKYGTHMAIAQAFALLFLKSGLATLKRDCVSIVALLTAFYPRYPDHSADNRYHLQALRVSFYFFLATHMKLAHSQVRPATLALCKVACKVYPFGVRMLL